MSSFTGMSCAQLFKKIGTPNAHRIIDTRLAEDYARDTALIPSSRRILHQTVLNTLQDKPQDTLTAKTVVVCQQGHKISNGTAAVLRAQGVPEEVLSGGFCAWHEQGLPLVSLQALPEKHRQAGLWVTRHRPKIDRIACPWLLRRFIDPDAHILFVPPSEVLAVADTFDAISFGIEQGEITHEGPLCTFEVMLERFELHSEALTRMARVIRAADTNQIETIPQAAGLLALSIGLSKLYRNDNTQLAAGMTLYDMLYLWARDGVNETYDWPR